MIEPQKPQCVQTSVMVSADLNEKFAINFMCWCEENKEWINGYSNKEKIKIFKKETEYDAAN